MQARGKADPLYIPYLTVQTLIQATGRGMRFAEDQCESVIFDDHIARLMAVNKNLFLGWWLKLYHRSAMTPDPLPKLKIVEGY